LRDGTIVAADQPSALPRRVGIRTLLLWWVIPPASFAIVLVALFTARVPPFNFPTKNIPVVSPVNRPPPLSKNTPVVSPVNTLPPTLPTKPTPQWERLAPGTTLANLTNDDVPVFRDSNVHSEQYTMIHPGDFVQADEHSFERAVVGDKAWYRFSFQGQFGFVPDEGKLKPIKQ
jgi:hypothetical protein